ncbi:MAG TPA: metallophosphoesterase family protein [Terriglobales bacterium]|nr:metallophosphoesterase family protein [Terriglobales bacterium]
MKTIVHISDLHFGRANPALATALTQQINVIRPDVVAVSGDLTQRAREREFQQAREFLQALSYPKIVVPGNHDVPLHDVVARFYAPLARYRRYITEDLEPYYDDDAIALLGINTARSLTFKNGRINREQVAAACERLDRHSEAMIRIVVTHHPFDLPASHRPRDLVGRARMAMIGFAACNVDVFLSGHLHLSGIIHTVDRYRIAGHSALVIQAGTAISTRGRGEWNSWNVIRISRPYLSVERFAWSPESGVFASTEQDHFIKRVDGWARTEQPQDNALTERIA